MNVTLIINAAFSLCAYFSTITLIPSLTDMFIKANVFGYDLNKTKKEKVPEAFGVVSGCIFLIVLFLFIPVPFGHYILDYQTFPHDQFVELLAALLSICCMLLLGFADDVLDLKWRHKLLLPTIASLPLLVVYYVNFNSTTIIVPLPLRPILGFSVNVGFLYYIYMGMLAVFCTNAINILAGVNGLEVGQSMVIASSIATHNFIELNRELWRAHQFSLYFMLPYLATSLALLKYNWYPSRVFVGDTFCYFSGMTFAVVGILGHFSKTMLLFFIPQVINFVYSMPQLFRLVPCPRHRMPKLNPKSGLLEMSTVKVKSKELNLMGLVILWFLRKSKIAYVIEEDNGETIVCNNLTLINLFLYWFGPTHEANLTKRLLIFQIICTCFAFCIRYPVAAIFYEMVI